MEETRTTRKQPSKGVKKGRPNLKEPTYRVEETERKTTVTRRPAKEPTMEDRTKKGGFKVKVRVPKVKKSISEKENE